jgi:hypothetical protein
MAIRARMRGLEGVEGPFWVCERGQVNAPEKTQKAREFKKPERRVA